MGVECGPTGVKSREERATSVDKRILELRPGCLDAYRVQFPICA